MQKSENCRMITEAFEITPSDLGISENQANLIVKEACGNVYGIKLEEKVRKNISGYLANL